jgi:hypothetical protein
VTATYFATPCRIRIDVAKKSASLHTVAKTLQGFNGFERFAEMNSHAVTTENSAPATALEERRLKPRSQVGRALPVIDINGTVVGHFTRFNLRATRQYRHAYRFEIGQQVQWGDEVWTVVGRQTSAMGRRFYTVTREGDERPVRTTIEVVLAPIA